jgi:excisionase family DNA binding protein
MNSNKQDSINIQKVYDSTEPTSSAQFFDNLIWGIDEVCSFTKYAKGTIYNLVSKGEIPHRTRGRKRRLVFVPSEIVTWIKGEPL